MKKQILILTLLLLQFGFSQEDLKMSSKLSECAALESDLARLACYDELAKKSVSVNNEKSETGTITSFNERRNQKSTPVPKKATPLETFDTNRQRPK